MSRKNVLTEEQKMRNKAVQILSQVTKVDADGHRTLTVERSIITDYVKEFLEQRKITINLEANSLNATLIW